MLGNTQLKVHAPIHVQLEVTWKCNWRCVHCYQEQHLSRGLPLDKLGKIFDDLARLGCLHVIVTGGEPLVRPDIFDVFERIRDNGMAITLYSNGHLITGSVADRLSSLVAEVELTVLAGESEVHDRLANANGAFNRTFSAIDYLLAKDVEVVVKTPLLRPAYPTLRKLEECLRQKGVEWICDPEISRSYSGESYPLDYKMSFEELKKFFQDFPQFRPGIVNRADAGAKDGMCLAARQHCFIDVFGNVYPCLNFKSSDVATASSKDSPVRMGNVLTSAFEDIWNSRIACDIRAASKSSFRVCSGCDAKDRCGGCMALNYEEHGQLFQPSSLVCNLTGAAVSVDMPAFVPASVLLKGAPVVD